MNLEQRLRASAKRFIAELDAALEEHQDFLRQRDQKMATSAPVGAFGRKPKPPYEDTHHRPPYFKAGDVLPSIRHARLISSAQYLDPAKDEERGEQ